MASSKKKKTTMAKMAREHKLRERRVDKQAKRDARKASAGHLDSTEGALNATGSSEDAQPAPEQEPQDAQAGQPEHG